MDSGGERKCVEVFDKERMTEKSIRTYLYGSHGNSIAEREGEEGGGRGEGRERERKKGRLSAVRRIYTAKWRAIQ